MEDNHNHHDPIDFDTTTKIQPTYQDNDSDVPEQDLKLLDLFEHLKQFALNINNIIHIPKKTEANKLRLIKEATQAIDFKDLQQLAALQAQQPVGPEEDFEEDSIEEIKRERDEYKRKAEQLQAEIEKTGHHGDIQLVNSLDQALLRLTDRRSSFEDQEKLIKLHQEEIDTYEVKVKELNEFNEKLIRKKADLEAQIEGYEREANMNEDYQVEQTKNKRLSEELKQKDDIIHTQKKALDDLNEQGKRLNAKIHDLQAERQDLRHQNDKLTEGYGSHQAVFKEQVNKLKHQLAEKEKALSQLSLQLQQQTEQLNINAAKISYFTAQMEKYSHQILILKEEKSNLQSQIKRVLEANRQQEYKYTVLNQQFHQIQSEKEKQQNQLVQFKNFMNFHEQSVVKHQNQIALLKKQCHAYKNEVSQPLTQKRIFDQIRQHLRHLQKQSRQQFKRNITITLAGLK